MPSRRQFLSRTASLLASAGIATSLTANVSTAEISDANSSSTSRPTRPLRLLILGGTRFIGLHMTELALARGHSVTFFNRGHTKTARFPQVERLQGDRNAQLDALQGRSWDAVIDNSGYVPRHVRLSAELLSTQVSQYLFVSSVSVYPNFAKPRNESSAVQKLKNPNTETVAGDSYGPLKAACELALRKVYGARATILRPGLIVGPDDNTDRFTYWPARAARGGEFIAPGSAADRIQYIDARDLAAFTVRCLEAQTHGCFNVVTPPGAVTMGALLDECRRAAIAQAHPATAPQPVWLPAAFLAAQDVQPWSDMPVWLPASGDAVAFADTPTRRASAAGLRCRAVARTVADTLAWQLARPAAERDALKAGIGATREAQVLAAWRSKHP